ncbi:MAG: DNA polymerase III subunit gamma/tau [Candidatus Levybacteria bacterium]|nr:DNA polymerase III subunit gamma/tau [Candidatus Levybacteria bacterium]
MVFYLKYRPKKISELDSHSVVSKLEGIIKGKLPDKIPHAFLFTGPKGLGKTSTARILAKSINCTNRKKGEIEPCNVCVSCKAINNGSSLDVLEIDGASNRGIDEIRDLREKIRLSPVASKKKIYIIDEVHMLTAEAFNALLKTLEEPPEHAFFILCTTEPQKIPQTIASRCFQIKFSKPTEEDFLHSFNRILKGEGIKADKEALMQIIKLSDGSFRDGAKILEELGSASKHITVNLIEKKFKTASIGKNVLGIISSFEKKDAGAGIKIVDGMEKEGVDFKLFSEELINTLHGRLLAQISGESFEMSIEQTKDLIQMLVKSHQSIKYTILPQLPLELTIVEWASSENPALPAGRSENSEIQNVSESENQKIITKSSSANLALKGETLQGRSSSNRPKRDKILMELIERIKKENFSLAGVLRGCKVEKFDKRELVLSTKYKFHKERLKDKKILDMLEKSIYEMTNKKVKVSIA